MGGFRATVATAVAVACLAAPAPVAAATTRYAAPAGSGTACSQVSPCALDEAVDNASFGDDVVVAPGTYALGAALTPADGISVHGVAGQPRPAITLAHGGPALDLGEFGARVDLTHLGIDTPEGTAIYGQLACYGTWDDLVLTAAGSAIDCLGGTPLIRDVVAHSTGAGNAALELDSSMGAGNSTYQLRNVTAIASGSGASALNVKAMGVDATIGDLNDTVVAKNLIALGGPGAFDLRAHGEFETTSATIDVSYSDYSTEEHTGPQPGTVTSSEGHNLTATPFFVNAAAGDFHQLASSPTIDAGKANDALNGSTDIDGDARALGLTTDIGADEYAPPAGGMATPHAHGSGVLLHDGRVLVAGGSFGGVQPRNAELFDPATGRWSGGGYMSKGRLFGAASVLESGKVLVSGGSEASLVGTADLYDPATNSWSGGGTLPGGVNGPRWHHTSTLLGSGRVLITGGSTAAANGIPNTALYNPATNTWAAGPALATGRYDHTATLLSDGRVLVVGGSDQANAPLKSAEVSNVGVSAWTSAGSMTTERTGHTATLLQNGKVLVAAGVDSSGEETATAELYDPASNTWSSAGSLAQARSSHTATLLRDGRVRVEGGVGPGLGALKSTEIYDPATNGWSAGPALGTARDAHTATGLLDGRVLTAGGEGLSSSELSSRFGPNAIARRPVVAYVDLQGHFGLWDSETLSDVPAPPVPADLTRFATSLDGRYVVYAEPVSKKIHLYDRRARGEVPLPGIDVDDDPSNLTVSDTGLIAFDHNSNSLARVYDSRAKTFLATGLVASDTGFESDNGHRQTRLSGDGRFLATTCQQHCVTPPVSGSDLYVQDLTTKTNFPMPNNATQDSEHPCVDRSGVLVGADLTVGGQNDISLYARAGGGLLPVPNDPTVKDVKCALDSSGQHVVLQNFATGTDRLYDRLAGALVPMPMKVRGVLFLSDPIDLTPPQTTILGGPARIVGGRRAVLRFASSEAGGTFRCSLDGRPFTVCASPKTYLGLKDGTHTFRVRAVDAAGNADPTPATRTWTIGTAITKLSIKPPSFNRAKGTTIAYVLTRAGTVRFTVCHKPNPAKRRCVPLKGTLKRTGKAGRNSFHFSGRLNHHALDPGSYVLTGRPGGRRAGFRIKPG
jgi:hypothetical protein